MTFQFRQLIAFKLKSDSHTIPALAA